MPEAPSALESEWLGLVHQIGCVVCARWGLPQVGPTEAHHVYEGVGLSQRQSHFMVAALCHEHHQGHTGIGCLGTRGFYARYNMDEVDCVALTIEAVFAMVMIRLRRAGQ